MDYLLKMLPWIGKLKIDETRDKYNLICNPDTRGYYVQRLEVYKKLLSDNEFSQDRKSTVYKYFVIYWKLMIINHDIDLCLL